MSQAKRLLVIDDHPLFREGLKAIVSRDPRYVVSAEAGSGVEALQLARSVKPEIILLDLSLPDGSGLDLIEQFKTHLPTVHIVVVSMHAKLDLIAAAFKAGAEGYLVKESTAERLLQALDAVTREQQYLDSAISPKVVQKLLEFSTRRAQMTDSAYGSLTQREQQIMRLLADGWTSSAIAGKLFITRKTVENHRANIMSKLGLKNLADLVRYAARLGLIDIDAMPE
ncbi:response regulator transcription factor [Desulfocurvibacter africanus]|uniref:Two component transcriptional regulator, LuxR family n=1 Tax=Desulfocurvibacter africanus subsp. africanus str. Walvis Bay TaxID=690850 RepID=F3Z2A6_DESAF|nr:response regulator transcription factor [Desulfocurvibacter africanus]EGJ50146.1 two component transcriptional regulator, LuxR family [Desulfocurvibacter africanus subsp. africanus str. Walvis Bay]